MPDDAPKADTDCGRKHLYLVLRIAAVVAAICGSTIGYCTVLVGGLEVRVREVEKHDAANAARFESICDRIDRLDRRLERIGLLPHERTMPMARATDLADAIVTLLNGHEFSQDFTAERQFRPRYEMRDLKTLRVTVVPGGLEAERYSRTEDAETYRVGVAVQKKLGDEANEEAEIETLLDLAEEIDLYLRAQRIDSPEAVWTGTEHPTLYDPDHLDQLRCFTSVLTLTYVTTR